MLSWRFSMPTADYRRGHGTSLVSRRVAELRRKDRASSHCQQTVSRQRSGRARPPRIGRCRGDRCGGPCGERTASHVIAQHGLLALADQRRRQQFRRAAAMLCRDRQRVAAVRRSARPGGLQRRHESLPHNRGRGIAPAGPWEFGGVPEARRAQCPQRHFTAIVECDQRTRVNASAVRSSQGREPSVIQRRNTRRTIKPGRRSNVLNAERVARELIAPVHQSKSEDRRNLSGNRSTSRDCIHTFRASLPRPARPRD